MPSDATPRTANEALAVAMLAPLGIDVALVPVETEMARQVLAALIASGWQIVRTVAAAPDPVASPLDVARATVERIRERLADNHNTLGAEVYRLDQIYDILEEFGA